MNRQQKILLIASNLYFKEAKNIIRIMTKEDGFSVLFDTETDEGIPENFGNNEKIVGLATTILKLQGKEKQRS